MRGRSLLERAVYIATVTVSVGLVLTDLVVDESIKALTRWSWDWRRYQAKRREEQKKRAGVLARSAHIHAHWGCSVRP